MSAGVPVNPYAKPPPRPGRAPQQATHLWSGPGRYSVPSVFTTNDPDYVDGAYSPELKSGGSSDGSALPDNVRIGRRKAPVEGGTYNRPDWEQKQDSEQNKRYTADHQGEMWSVKQSKVPAGQNPLWTQERMPTRPTATNSPTGIIFGRYWHIPRNVADVFYEDSVDDNGVSRQHFSMADHRRKYEILGMKPQGKVGANTYRADPKPWDDTLFVAPSPSNVSSIVPPANRSYRLG